MPGASFVSDQGMWSILLIDLHSLAAVREIDPDPRWEELCKRPASSESLEALQGGAGLIAISPEGSCRTEGFDGLPATTPRVAYLRLADEEADSVFLAYPAMGRAGRQPSVVQALSDLAVLEKSEDPGFLGLRSLLVCKVRARRASLRSEPLLPATLLLFTHLVWARNLFNAEARFFFSGAHRGPSAGCALPATIPARCSGTRRPEDDRPAMKGAALLCP